MLADRVDMSKRRVGTVSEIELVNRSEQVRKVGIRMMHILAISGYFVFLDDICKRGARFAPYKKSFAALRAA